MSRQGIQAPHILQDTDWTSSISHGKLAVEPAERGRFPVWLLLCGPVN